ncbi:MAG: GNAT family N-acetyltransferase [Oscillospiraceae bacterium]|nr:GNAT family N-acetyltransferase [Oscillospiraceae bacterium]
MLQIRDIRESDYKPLYSQMKRDFLHELAPYFAIKRNLENNIYNGFFLTEDTDKDIGYAIITAPENLKYSLINYFAISSEHRSKGYGSEFLKIILSRYFERILVLEVDAPAKNAAPDDKDVRRIKFYERAGFRVIPTKKAKIFGVDMLIMANIADKSDEQFSAREIMHALYLPALGSKQWLRFVDVID